ncbi:MAG: hypothetical protein ACU0BN_13765 [Sulfitobacter sp.]
MQKVLSNMQVNLNSAPVLMVEHGTLRTSEPIETQQIFARSIAGAVDVGELAENSGRTSAFESDVANWRTYNFEVAELHTYVADGIRVHNASLNITEMNDDGSIKSLTNSDGDPIKIKGKYTPEQLHHYGRVKTDENGVITEIDPGTVGQQLGSFARSLADALGLDGRIGYQGTFRTTEDAYLHKFEDENGNPIDPLDWSGDKDDDGIDDWKDETYSNIGHWGGDRDGDGVPNYRDRNDGVGWRDKNESGGGDTSGSGKPVVLDLDGDGVEINVDQSVNFDIDADGFLEPVSWVSPDDGFLVVDLNSDHTRGAGDGKIDSALELAFSAWTTSGMTDLEALAKAVDVDGNRIFDTDGNGVLNSNDGIWQELRIWQDLDQDGETEGDGSELKTLAQWGITSINLTYDDGSDYGDHNDDVWVFGNTLFGTASYKRNGQTVEGGVGDVALSFDANGYREVENNGQTQYEYENGDMLLLGSDGNDQLIGTENVDHLVSSKGNDTLIGGAGGDHYKIDRDGDYEILEFDWLKGNSLTLVGVDFSDVNIVQHSSWAQFTWNKEGVSGSAYIQGWNTFAKVSIGGTSFVSLEEDSYEKWELKGGGDADFISASGDMDRRYYLQGGEGDDTLVANASTDGWNYMGGQGGSDTYIYFAAAGDVRVSAWGEGAGEGTDTFRFADVYMKDVTFSTEDASKDADGTWLQASFSDKDGNPHKVQFANLGHQINRFEFADGSNFKRVKFGDGNFVDLEGSNGDDLIYSPTSSDRRYYLQGMEGNDTLVADTDAPGRSFMAGREGNDTYRYYADAGDMRVSIWGEPDGFGWDRFIFEDLNLSDVTFSTAPAGSSDDGIYLVAAFTDANNDPHTVEFANQGAEINWFEFADGLVMSHDEFVFV